jgi:hypothetical protein
MRWEKLACSFGTFKKIEQKSAQENLLFCLGEPTLAARLENKNAPPKSPALVSPTLKIEQQPLFFRLIKQVPPGFLPCASLRAKFLRHQP